MATAGSASRGIAPPEYAASTREHVRRSRRVFPGSRIVWLAGGAVLVAFSLAILAWSLVPREYYTGTNSVRVLAPVANLNAGDRICVPGEAVPPRTARVRLGLYFIGIQPALDLEVRGAGRVVRSSLPASKRLGFTKVDFPIQPLSESHVTPTTLCLVAHGYVQVGGDMRPVVSIPEPRVNGRALPVRVAVWYLPRAGARSSLISRLATMLHRASVLRPGIVGPWTYLALFFVLTPALAYAALRLLAITVAGERPRRIPLVVAVGLLAFLNAAGWSLVSPVFDTPDETEHFAYAQFLAQRHFPPDPRQPSPRPPYSTREAVDVDVSRIQTYVAAIDGKPPWIESVTRRQLAAALATAGQSPPQDNGGGPTAASVHSPLYYALLAPAYWASGTGSSFDEVQAMRLVSALLCGLTVVFIFLALGELVPGWPLVGLAGALLAAFQPMVAFMGGAVNNDNGVNAAAALLAWLLLRGLRRGLTVRLAIAIAATGVALPLMKGTGYALYPAAALALAGTAWRQRRAGMRLREALKPWLWFAAVGPALLALWALYAHRHGRRLFTTPGGGAPTGHVPGASSPLDSLAYLWQTFLPRLPFMRRVTAHGWPAYNIYVERGFAAFGAYSIVFPPWVYVVIVTIMLGLGVLALATLVREREWMRRHLLELAVLVAIILGVVGGVAFAYYTPDGAHRLVPSEQGRYAFTMLVPLAAIAVGACFAFGRRTGAFVAAILAVAMLGFGVTAQWMAFTSYFG